MKIIFIGPIAPQGTIPQGGYESANRHTIDNLLKRNVDVLELPYPVTSGTILNKTIQYTSGFAKNLPQLIYYLFSNKNSETICHITGLYRHFIYVELFFVLIAKLMGKAVIYEIRAGAMLKYYQNRTRIYKIVFFLTLKNASIVSIEGKEYAEFIENKVGKMSFYFPNYVDQVIAEDDGSIIRRANTIKPIKLIYFGRVTPEKGIEVIIDTALHLEAKGYDVILDIIGSASEQYFDLLTKKVIEHPNINVTPPLAQTSLYSQLKNYHFFIFPTQHTGEGQSNSLTEAMANGCVAICSDNGFNNSVVDDCGVIIPKKQHARAYGDAVIEIVKNDQWKTLSNKTVNRIHEFYFAPVVIDKLINLYRKLLINNA